MQGTYVGIFIENGITRMQLAEVLEGSTRTSSKNQGNVYCWFKGISDCFDIDGFKLRKGLYKYVE